VNEWKTPGKKTIERCAVNMRQVVIALTGGELVYFEMDPVRVHFSQDTRQHAPHYSPIFSAMILSFMALMLSAHVEQK